MNTGIKAVVKCKDGDIQIKMFSMIYKIQRNK